MTPVKFEQHNHEFGPPTGFTESQVQTIWAYEGQVSQGSVDGVNIIITAWRPNEQQIQDIVDGKPIFMTMMGHSLYPHFLTTRFEDATNPR